MTGSGDFSIGSDVWSGISKLIEEAGEVTQVCGKLIAIAGASEHWDGTDLRERLEDEIADLSILGQRHKVRATWNRAEARLVNNQPVPSRRQAIETEFAPGSAGDAPRITWPAIH